MSSGWHYQDEAFFNVTEGIRKVAVKVMSSLTPSSQTLPIAAFLKYPSNKNMEENEVSWLEKAIRFVTTFKDHSTIEPLKPEPTETPANELQKQTRKPEPLVK